jgi:serine protease Do
MGLFQKVRQQKLLSVSLLLFTLSIGIIIGTLINTGVNAARAQGGAADATPLVTPSVTQMPSNQFVELAKKSESSVVNISTEYTPKVRQGRAPQNDEEGDESMDLFRRFFGEEGPGSGRMPPRAFRRQATGSGFVVDKNGYILTNYHVIDKADQIKVKIPHDPSDYRAKLIGYDVETDLAVIKVDPRSALAPTRIGNSDGVQVGDWAIAIGSPFGLEATVTAGIVSATGRDVPGAEQFQRFIQTDAAINPGNSGGPLLNIAGEVIGINTAIATATGGYQGVGFALPINTAVTVYNSIIKTGKMSRGSIGITFRKYANNQQVLKALGFDKGVIIESVNEGGPAQRSGLKADDVILAFNGKPVTDGDDLVSRVSTSAIGSTQTITVDRGGKRMDFKVEIGDREEQLAASNDPRFGNHGAPSDEGVQTDVNGAKFGVRIRSTSDAERQAANIEQGGVVVTTVDPGSFAEEVGLQEKDIIVSINRQAVASVDEVRAVQSKLKAGDAVAFRVLRPMPVPQRSGGAQQYVGTYVAGTLPAK